jgi:hypothetical protein
MPVHVFMIITIPLIGFVIHVLTNVMVVLILLLTVLLVPKTESNTQPVTVQVDTTMSTKLNYVQNVTVSVILVTNPDLA